jgi:hypothetical protein
MPQKLKKKTWEPAFLCGSVFLMTHLGHEQQLLAVIKVRMQTIRLRHVRSAHALRCMGMGND